MVAVVTKYVIMSQKVCFTEFRFRHSMTLTITAIMLRNLDALTTEDSVMQVLTAGLNDVVKTVSGVCIGRDPLTSTSRGICYLGTESTVDALALYGALTNLNPPLTIDGKTGTLSITKELLKSCLQKKHQ